MHEDVFSFDRSKHPFCKMNVDQVIQFESGDFGKIQSYAHSYGFSSGKKFMTRRKDGILYVKRVS